MLEVHLNGKLMNPFFICSNYKCQQPIKGCCCCFFKRVNNTHGVVTFKAPFIIAVEGHTYLIVHC